MSEKPQKPKLLLHACCGVCSSYIPSVLIPDYDVTIYYENSNIYPAEEFVKRAEAAKIMAESYGIPFIEAPQRPTDWYRCVRGFASAPERGPRCEQCIRFRIEDAFRYAKEQGFDVVACTLSVGRAKNSQMINDIGNALSIEFGIPFLDRDWKKNGGEEMSQRIAKEKEIYRQDYCGCVYSKRDRDSRAASISKQAGMIALCLAVMTMGSGGGCVRRTDVSPQTIGSVLSNDALVESASEDVFSWHAIAPGIERGVQSIPQGEWDAQMILYRFDPSEYDFGFMNDPAAPKYTSDWSNDENILFAINGVYFHEDYSPSGFLRINGEDQGERSFDEEKTGMIVLNPYPSIIDTAVEVTPATSTTIAQSYPMLIKDGRSDIQEDSGKKARRSFFGMDQSGHVVLGVVVGGELSLYELAQKLESLPVDWDRVMNLDGGTSTGFASNVKGAEESFDSYATVPSIIYVKEK